MSEKYQYHHKYWLSLFPELLFFEDEEIREAEFRMICSAVIHRASYLVIFLFLFGLIGVRVMLNELSSIFPSLLATRFWLEWVIVVLLIPPGILYLLRCTVRGEIRASLNAHGIPVCMSCGYCLRGLVVQRCPECGQACQGECET